MKRAGRMCILMVSLAMRCPLSGDNFSTRMRKGLPNLAHMDQHATYEP